MATLELKLSKTSSVFVTVDPTTPNGDQTQDKRKNVSKTSEKLQANFDKISSSLRQVVESLEKQLQALAKKPDKIELEMGVELKGEADLWIVSGEAKAHMKIKLAWDNKQGK